MAADVTRLAESTDVQVRNMLAMLREECDDFEPGWTMIGGRQQATVSGGQSPLAFRLSSILDHSDGACVPFYRTEFELRSMRAKARNLATFTSVSIGALESLRSYTMGGQWEYKVAARQGVEVPPGLLAALQKVVDDAIEANEFVGVLDEEIHDKSREDGEALVAIYHAGLGRSKIVRHDADCLTEPQSGNAVRFDRVLGWSVPTSWTFGVHTVYDPMQRRIDHAAAKGYHVTFNDGGTVYDYLPAFPHPGDSRIAGKAGVLIKRNVPQAAKRGVSDFYPIQAELERLYVLGRNLSIGGAIQAAIAGIEEHAEGVTQQQAQAEIVNALDQISRAATAVRSDGKTVQSFEPGTIKKMSFGKKWLAGPLGELRSPIFIEICNYLLRIVGVRWNMPEYMISGDASNSNFASTLVAESPFIKARESDQRNEVRNFRRIFRCVLKIAYDNHRFDRWSHCIKSWADLMNAVELKIKPPVVASRDKAAMVVEDQALYDAGLITGNEWRQDTQRDPVDGLDAYKKPEPKPTAFGLGAGGGDFDRQSQPSAGLSLNGAQATAASNIIQQVAGGQLPGDSARALLQGVGITPSDVDTMLRAASDMSSASPEEQATAALDAVAAKPRRESARLAAFAEAVSHVRSLDQARAIARAM